MFGIFIFLLDCPYRNAAVIFQSNGSGPCRGRVSTLCKDLSAQGSVLATLLSKQQIDGQSLIEKEGNAFYHVDPLFP